MSQTPASWRKQRMLALLLPTSVTTLSPYPRQQGLVALSQALLISGHPRKTLGCVDVCSLVLGKPAGTLSRESTSYPLVLPTSPANACRFLSGFPPLPSTLFHSGSCFACPAFSSFPLPPVAAPCWLCATHALAARLQSPQIPKSYPRLLKASFTSSLK